MNLSKIVKQVEKLAIDNSPAILTVIGITGTVTTAFLTGKATFKAAEILANEERIINRRERLQGTQSERRYLTLKEKISFVWKIYVPAIGTGVITIACIIGANHIGSRRSAALAAAYSISEKAIVEYRDKVVEKIGVSKEKTIRDELAQDRITRNPVSEKEVIITGNGDVLCYESFTGRYFNSSMETLKKAQNDLNYTILHDSYASLSDFYNKIDIPITGHSDEVGWNSDAMLELEFSTCLSEDGRPCISIGFMVTPIRDYYRLH